MDSAVFRAAAAIIGSCAVGALLIGLRALLGFGVPFSSWMTGAAVGSTLRSGSTRLPLAARLLVPPICLLVAILPDAWVGVVAMATKATGVAPAGLSPVLLGALTSYGLLPVMIGTILAWVVERRRSA